MIAVQAQSFQSCPILCDPMDCSPPGSSVHGILQARILEWVAMSSSRGSSQIRDQNCISCISRQINIICCQLHTLQASHSLNNKMFAHVVFQEFKVCCL